MDDEGGADVPEVDDVDLEEGEISDEAPDAEEPQAKEPSAEAQPENLKSNGSCLIVTTGGCSTSIIFTEFLYV